MSVSFNPAMPINANMHQTCLNLASFHIAGNKFRHFGVHVYCYFRFYSDVYETHTMIHTACLLIFDSLNESFFFKSV